MSPKNILIICENSPTGIALEKVLNLFGWNCRISLIETDERYKKYPSPVFSGDLSDIHLAVFIHDKQSQFTSAQYFCLAAKLRCPPASFAYPIVVWSLIENPLDKYSNLISNHDLADLSVKAEQYPKSLYDVFSCISEKMNLEQSKIIWHERCLPLWLFAIELESQHIPHAVAGLSDLVETKFLFNMVLNLLFSHVQGRKRWIMTQHKHVIIFDDSVANNGVLVETFRNQLETELRKQSMALQLPVVFEVKTDPRLDPKSVCDTLNDNTLNIQAIVMDLGRDEQGRDQTDSFETLQFLETQDVHVLIWTGAGRGNAYDKAKQMRLSIFAKIGTNPAGLMANHILGRYIEENETGK